MAKKKEKKAPESSSIMKAMLPAMGAGLLVGGAKGYAERGIESGIKKFFQRRSIANALAKLKMKPSARVPWGIARGATSALAGIPYTLSAVIAAKELNKGKKSK